MEPPACRARAACHCLCSVIDVLFVACAHTHTRRLTHRHRYVHADCKKEREREIVAVLCLSVLSTPGWVPPLFREEDVISRFKNPTYVACHSWLNPGFSFVQCFPSPPLLSLSLALFHSSFLFSSSSFFLLCISMMKYSGEHCMCILRWTFWDFMYFRVQIYCNNRKLLELFSSKPWKSDEQNLKLILCFISHVSQAFTCIHPYTCMNSALRPLRVFLVTAAKCMYILPHLRCKERWEDFCNKRSINKNSPNL